MNHFPTTRPFLVLVILPMFFFACGNGQREPINTADSSSVKTEADKEQEKSKQSISIRYSAFPTKSDSARKAFKETFSKEEKEVIYGLNRVDARHVFNPDTLVVPDTFLTDWLQYSPFPSSLPVVQEVEKLVVFSYPIQAFAAYEKGRMIRWGPSSMGSRKHPTPTGLHFSNWKSMSFS